MADSTNTDWLSQLISGVSDLFQGARGQTSNQGNTAASMADPLNKYRGAFAGQLSDLISNPSSINNDPGFQYGQNQALEGVNRGMGPTGQLYSGQRPLSLADTSERYAKSWYDDKVSQLTQLSSGSPTAAAASYLSGQQGNANQIGAGVGSLGDMISQLIGGGSGALSGIAKLFQSGGGGSSVGTVGGIGGNESGGIDLGGYNDLAPGGSGSGLSDLINGGGGFNWDDFAGAF